MRNDTVTLFLRDPETPACFIKRVIRGVTFFSSHALTSVNGGVIGGNSFKVFIPLNAVAEGNFPFLPPKEFAIFHENSYTLRVGDIAVKGECDHIPESEADILQNHDEAFVISSVSEYPFGSARAQHRLIEGGDWRGR